MNEDNRKTICSYIAHNKKLIEISKIINELFLKKLKEIEKLLIIQTKKKVDA